MKTLIALFAVSILTLSALAGDIVIYPQGIVTNNLAHNVNCPGDNRWHASYTKTPSQGWGWFVDTSGGNTLFSATITNRTDTHITFTGSMLDTGCGTTVVVIPNPPFSPKYRFTVWGTNNPPATTNDLPLVLHGFLP